MFDVKFSGYVEVIQSPGQEPEALPLFWIRFEDMATQRRAFPRELGATEMAGILGRHLALGSK